MAWWTSVSIYPCKFDECDHLFDVLERPARATELSNIHALPVCYFCRRITFTSERNIGDLKINSMLRIVISGTNSDGVALFLICTSLISQQSQLIHNVEVCCRSSMWEYFQPSCRQ